MNETDEINFLIDDILNESSLSRLLSHRNNFDSGCISAFRSEYYKQLPDKRIKTKTQENRKRNAALRQELKSLGYSITKIDGFWQEDGWNAPNIEESIFVVDTKRIGNLKEDLIRLGKKYDQESILFKPAHKEPILIKTKGKRFGMKSKESHKTEYGKRSGWGWSEYKGSKFADHIDDDDFFDSKLD